MFRAVPVDGAVNRAEQSIVLLQTVTAEIATIGVDLAGATEDITFGNADSDRIGSQVGQQDAIKAFRTGLKTQLRANLAVVGVDAVTRDALCVVVTWVSEFTQLRNIGLSHVDRLHIDTGGIVSSRIVGGLGVTKVKARTICFDATPTRAVARSAIII